MNYKEKVGLKVLSLLLHRLPPENEQAYRFCRAYVDIFLGENISDISSNGEMDLLRSRLPASQVVVDVGANIGDWIAIAIGINPDLTVHAFEPSAATYGRLSRRNFPKTVRCNQMGLGSRREKRDLFVFSDGSELNSLYLRRGLEEGYGITEQTLRETVSMDTLDNYCADAKIENIDFMKVDVEGHELEVFKGAMGLLSGGGISAIQFEYGGCNIDSGILLRDIFDFFRGLPYVFHKVYPGRLRRVERYDQRLENYQYQNWVLVAE